MGCAAKLTTEFTRMLRSTRMTNQAFKHDMCSCLVLAKSVIENIRPAREVITLLLVALRSIIGYWSSSCHQQSKFDQERGQEYSLTITFEAISRRRKRN